VISTISSMPFSYEPGANDLQTTDIQGSLNLIEAARAAHVSHFVYTSIPEQFAVDFPLQSAKIQVEKALKESGLVYTILQPTYFMELWLSPAVGFDAANAKAVIYGMGENGISWISLYDVARFAVACLDNPAAKNTTLLLGGPAAVSPSAVVKLFEQAANRPFEVQHVPEEALQAQQAAASDPMQQSFTGLMRCYAQGRTIDMSATAETFAIQPTPLEEYVKRALALA
jgi:uncharacterized protein YbjT (DUF2867 family)